MKFGRIKRARTVEALLDAVAAREIGSFYFLVQAGRFTRSGNAADLPNNPKAQLERSGGQWPSSSSSFAALPLLRCLAALYSPCGY